MTAGNVTDCTVAVPLLESLSGSPAAVLANRGYDSDAIRYCRENNSRPVIPPRINRKNSAPMTGLFIGYVIVLSMRFCD